MKKGAQKLGSQVSIKQEELVKKVSIFWEKLITLE